MIMKRVFLIIMAVGLISAQPSFAQNSGKVDKQKHYLSAEQLPDASKFLPNPPEFGSEAFKLDSLVYEQGKRLRNSERGKLAIEDAKTSVKFVLKRFSPAMEHELTPETYPKVAELIKKSNATARLSIAHAKEYYHRKRPYQYFGEPSSVPDQEDPNDLTSYPSGHTIRFWTSALVLAALDPDHQEAILKTGYDMGQSRTIVGFHYQSDVDAARLAASAAFARMSVDPLWRKAFRKAKRELNRK